MNIDMKKISLISFVLIFFAASLNFAQSGKSTSAFLFGYTIKEGQNSHFENGYMRHLDWHKRNNDPLVWYAWYIVTGERLGWFVDGTFNLTHKDFDNRVKLGEDGADFRQTTTPFVNDEFRRVFKLKYNISTAFPLENYNPTRFMKVCRYYLKPGREKDFIQILKSTVEILKNENVNCQMTVYELTDGDRYPAFYIIFHGNKFEDFDNNYSSVNDIITSSNDYGKLLRIMKESVDNVLVETWSYRPNLSLIPE